MSFTIEVLRCEDIDRESRVDTDEFRIARQNLQDKNMVYQQCIAAIEEAEQEKIKDYVEALEEYSSEECQQSYLQGIVDCMLILCGAGIFFYSKQLSYLQELY